MGDTSSMMGGAKHLCSNCQFCPFWYLVSGVSA